MTRRQFMKLGTISLTGIAVSTVASEAMSKDTVLVSPLTKQSGIANKVNYIVDNDASYMYPDEMAVLNVSYARGFTRVSHMGSIIPVKIQG